MHNKVKEKMRICTIKEQQKADAFSKQQSKKDAVLSSQSYSHSVVSEGSEEEDVLTSKSFKKQAKYDYMST